MRGISFERYDSYMLKVGGDFSDPNPVTITLEEGEELMQFQLYFSTYDYTPSQPVHLKVGTGIYMEWNLRESGR